MKILKVLSPGAFTTVQDLGRFGYQRMGIPISGALDRFAFQAANLLVANPPEAAVLEITVIGPRIEFLGNTQIALTGAQMDMTLNGESIPGWQSIAVGPGDQLNIRQVVSGCRAYLAIHGGIDVPVVMGSRATYVGGQMGGFKGRPLAAGDVLSSGPGAGLDTPRRMPREWIPAYPEEIVLRAIPGPQDDFFGEGLDTLFAADYRVTTKADRMGCRLKGPEIDLLNHMPPSIISEPSMPGSIQVPADHQPIVLLGEQTVGGYAKIATVISTDLPCLAQAKPGDTVRFESIDLETAHRVYKNEAARYGRLIRLFS